MARLKGFYAQLPGKIRMQLDENMRYEFARGMDYELGWEQQKRIVSAEDQDAVEHFFSEYLAPQQPPSEMREPMHVARMVRCVTWANDTDIFQKGNRKDVWQSPTFFLEMRKVGHPPISPHVSPDLPRAPQSSPELPRAPQISTPHVLASRPPLPDADCQGDSEDHALLMCNLLLGLGLDAYICVGRLKDCSEGEKRHTWVMTREANGDVLMWETTQGQYVPTPRCTSMGSPPPAISPQISPPPAKRTAPLSAPPAPLSPVLTGADRVVPTAAGTRPSWSGGRVCS